MRTSIICVGNEYQKDDGFGPEVAAYLQGRYSFPEGARVLDRSVMGYEIVPDVRECDFAVVVDALDSTGAAPGTLFEFDPEDMRASAGMLSLHEVRFADVLEAARFLGAECSGRCFGVQVVDRGRGALERGLSDAVAAAVAPCARSVVHFLRSVRGVDVVDKWEEFADPRAALGDPKGYVREALKACGIREPQVSEALDRVHDGMADYELDRLVASLLRSPA